MTIETTLLRLELQARLAHCAYLADKVEAWDVWTQLVAAQARLESAAPAGTDGRIDALITRAGLLAGRAAHIQVSAEPE